MNYVASGYVRSGYVRQDNDTVDGVTFDRYGKHLYISEDVARINLTEVYTATKDWLVQDDNMRNLPPMRYSGYDPIPGGYTGTTFFMINGWKLVYNPNTTAISGVLFSEDYDTGYWSYADLPIYPVMVSATVNTVYKEFGTSGLTEDESKKLSSIPTAEEIWAYVDRTLTESVAATVNAEDIWTHPTRSLTDGSGLDESQLHTALDAYSNKNLWKADTSVITAVNTKVDSIKNTVESIDVPDKITNIELHEMLDTYPNKSNWKAQVPVVDLSPILVAIAGLNNLSLLDIEGSTALAKETTLTAIASAVAQIPTTDSAADLTPVLSAIAGLNDVSAAEVRSAFDAADFKDKNTEAELHAWLDTYTNKDNWKVDPDVVRDKVWSKVV